MQVSLAKRKSRDTLQDGACFENVFPHVQNKALKAKLARKKDSPPRERFTNRFKQSLKGLRAKGDDLGERLGGRT